MDHDILRLALQLAIEEEKNRVKPTVTAVVKPVEKPVTKSLIFKNRSVSNRLDVLNLDKPGRLVEATLISDGKNYSLLVETDGVLVLDGSFDELQSISEYVGNISAFDTNGTYVLHITDFKWASSARIFIYPRKETLFSEIIVLWEENVWHHPRKVKNSRSS